jgi:hypothetical protein
VTIELTSTSILCWLTKAKLSKDGTRYTTVLTLTKKTVKAIEKEKGLNNNN